jgi:gas vesicle protein
MINAHDAVNTAVGGAKAAVEGAKAAAETATAAVGSAAGVAAGAATKAALGTKGYALEAAVGAMQLLKLARHIDADDVLGLMGLMRRRRNPLGAIALLGGGMAIGAGIGLLLAPVSGREARAFLMRTIGGLGGKVTDEVETLQGRATEVVEQVQERASEIAGQVQEKAASIAGQDQEASGGQDQETEGEGEGRRGGKRGRPNHNTQLS